MDVSSAAVAALLKNSGHEIESEIHGESMHPTLTEGSRIRIRCGRAHYQPGDIVAILGEPLIAHRVVGLGLCRSRRFVITRGDASWFCDPPVREEQILGVVTAYDDGRGWQPLQPWIRATGAVPVLTTLLLVVIRGALSVNERFAVNVARGTSLVACWCGRRE